MWWCLSPMPPHWQVYIKGKKAKTYDFENLLMLKLPAGNTILNLKYRLIVSYVILYIWVMNMKTHMITESEYNAVKEMTKKNQNKRIDRRLQVIILRYEGCKDSIIGEKVGYHPKRVSQLCAEFKSVGLEVYAKQKYSGNNRSLNVEDEDAILKAFEEKAKDGTLVTVQEIKQAFDEKLEKDTGRGYIYMLLKRHGWRKIMPRSKHPKKASEEDIDASKKLTKNSKKNRSYPQERFD
jgi:transposase